MMLPGQTGTWPLIAEVDKAVSRRRRQRVAIVSVADSGLTKRGKPPRGMSIKLAKRSLFLIVLGYVLIGFGYVREVATSPDRMVSMVMKSLR